MKCPHCNQEHPDGFQFCPTTGQKINVFKACTNSSCPENGKYTLPIDSMYCPVCGSKLDSFDKGQNGDERVFNVNGVSFKMIKVESGTFDMGDYKSSLCPIHSITLSHDYFVGETPVTQALWLAVMGNNPSSFKGTQNPVENVNWNYCEEFIKNLNHKTNCKFRLPTEAEWEFAARGGTNSNGYEFSGSNNIQEVAWYNGNSGSKTHPVKQKKPNELGIYDMSGNVWELCNDWLNHNYYTESPNIDPKGPSSGSYRVTRGGSWDYGAGLCCVWWRSNCSPDSMGSDLGFRLALSE